MSDAPFGFAYEYPDGIRFDTAGREINGSRPTRTILLYSQNQLEDAVARAVAELTQYKIALEGHLCKYDLIDWLACVPGTHDVSFCQVCEEAGDHGHDILRKAKDQIEIDARIVETTEIDYYGAHGTYSCLSEDRHELAAAIRNQKCPQS